MVGSELSHYTILEQIGAGGMGVVYRAHDLQLERDVAIKVLPPGTLTDEIARKHFRKEALALARLNHPNVETIFEFGSESGLDFLVTEYIPGQTLDERLTAGPLEEKEVLALGAQLIAGVTAAHEQGMVHRDLKPGNLRLTPDGRLKLLDFGLARLTQADMTGASVSDLAQTCGARGTLPYMAPEQLCGQKVDSRSDVWAIGAVLYEMATACRPFPQTESGELMIAILQLPPESPRSKNFNISPGLEAVILKALSKRPAERYQSAIELGADLGKLSATVSPTKAPQAAYQPSSPTPSPSSTKLELAHVLFMDIVAYSRMLIDEQGSVLRKLQEIVRGTNEFTRASNEGELIPLPTGDGMALVFFQDAEAPVRCAVEIARKVREEGDLKLRLGIHTGPVYRVADINANLNVAGGGINLAQRVMDCADAGHILVSQAVADVLEQMSSWATKLHDLGEAEVKHGVRVHIYNLYTDEVGNPELPQKIRLARDTVSLAHSRYRRKRLLISVMSACVLVGGIVGGLLYSRRAHALTEKDTVVIADFANKTGDTIFDSTLRQGLSAQLEQSPFLNLLPNSRLARTLKFMTKPKDTPLTPEVAREVCQRTGSAATIEGSISMLGSQYVLDLNAVNCHTGDRLVQQQVTANSKEEVLGALGKAATGLREQLGESLLSVQKHDKPLFNVTTSSLDALKAYTTAIQTFEVKGETAAIPYAKQAVALDPNFAQAYTLLGTMYANLGQTNLATAALKKAYELSDRVSDKEKYSIMTFYYANGTGDLEKAIQNYQAWTDLYPKDEQAISDLGAVYNMLGQYDKALPLMQEGLRMDPDGSVLYANLAGVYLALNQPKDATEVFKQAATRNVDSGFMRQIRYYLSFLNKDAAGMADQVSWATNKPGDEDLLLSLESDTQGYHGRLNSAREYSRQASESAIRADAKDTAALWRASAAVREAEFGNTSVARQMAESALALSPGRDVKVLSALALAHGGDIVRASSIVTEVEKANPANTIMNVYWLPIVNAVIATQRGDYGEALRVLEPASQYELGEPFPYELGTMYPAYERGLAYLQAKKADAAAAEFQKILDHPGITLNFFTGALAHLQLARAKAMGHHSDEARKAYQDFFALWTDADADIPVLKQAKSEFSKLK